MKKSTWIGILCVGIAVFAVASRNFWISPEADRAWHRTWLSGGHGADDPRNRIVAEHELLLARIEDDYRERIDREKKLNEIYALEYERLIGEPAKP